MSESKIRNYYNFYTYKFPEYMEEKYERIKMHNEIMNVYPSKFSDIVPPEDEFFKESYEHSRTLNQCEECKIDSFRYLSFFKTLDNYIRTVGPEKVAWFNHINRYGLIPGFVTQETFSIIEVILKGISELYKSCADNEEYIDNFEFCCMKNEIVPLEFRTFFHVDTSKFTRFNEYSNRFLGCLFGNGVYGILGKLLFNDKYTSYIVNKMQNPYGNELWLISYIINTDNLKDLLEMDFGKYKDKKLAFGGSNLVDDTIILGLLRNFGMDEKQWAFECKKIMYCNDDAKRKLIKNLDRRIKSDHWEETSYKYMYNRYHKKDFLIKILKANLNNYNDDLLCAINYAYYDQEILNDALEKTKSYDNCLKRAIELIGIDNKSLPFLKKIFEKTTNFDGCADAAFQNIVLNEDTYSFALYILEKSNMTNETMYYVAGQIYNLEPLKYIAEKTEVFSKRCLAAIQSDNMELLNTVLEKSPQIELYTLSSLVRKLKLTEETIPFFEKVIEKIPYFYKFGLGSVLEFFSGNDEIKSKISAKIRE